MFLRSPCRRPPPAHADPLLSALVAAYPDHLSGYDENAIVWKNGARMPVSDGIAHKSFEQLLARPDIKDIFALPYPLGGNSARRRATRTRDASATRRSSARCMATAARARWRRAAPRRLAAAPRRRLGDGDERERRGGQVRRRLARARRLPDLAKYAAGSAGAYSCRSIAGTRRLSFHGYGAAIDLNLRFSDYWLWKAKTGSPVWRNRIPAAIVEIFERHGFIWGGKWYHYDTMHFEYRPELIAAAKAQ